MKSNLRQWVAALTLGGLLAAGVNLTAADNGNSKPKARAARAEAGGRRAAVRERLQVLAKELELTAEQKTKVGEVLKKEAEKLQGMRGDTGVTVEQRREKLREVRNHASAELKKILTPEQFKNWQSLRQERAGQAGRRGTSEKAEV